MGLADRKQKQRIPSDPRNLSWADDTSRFGLSYLSKFGWNPSQGLGPSGHGMKTHLKIQQKLDMMGIGAQHQRDPNGIAWKQNKDFEALLKRLNNSAERTKEADEENGGEAPGCVRPLEAEMGEAFLRAQEEKAVKVLGNEFSTAIKKRRHEGEDELDAGTRKRKKEKKEKKKEKHHTSSDDIATPAVDPICDPLSTQYSKPTPKSRPMAHRARIRAAKCIAGKSASAIAEILGITPSSASTSASSIPTFTPPASSSPTSQPSLSLDNLTTSTKSVADYFKEKLLARSSSYSSSASSLTHSGFAPPGPAITTQRSTPDDQGELPQRGIGSSVPTGFSFSRALELQSANKESDTNDQDILTTQRQKVKRKAEKRKQQVAEAIRDTYVCIPSALEANEEDAEGGMTSKQRGKHKKRQEQKEQAPIDQFNDSDRVTEKEHEHQGERNLLPAPERKRRKRNTCDS